MAEYKIKKGDTLGKIAKDNNTTVEELAKLNDITDVNKIRAGDTLQLTAPEATTAQGTNPESEDSLMEQAEGLYQPSYDAQVESVEQEAQAKQTALERLIQQANNQYAMYQSDLEDQTSAAIDTRTDAINREMIKRGMGRSTYSLDRLNTETGDIQEQAQKLLAKAGLAKTTAIEDYGRQSLDVTSAKEAALKRAAADYETNVLNQYYILRDQAWQKDIAERQLALQEKAASGGTTRTKTNTEPSATEIFQATLLDNISGFTMPGLAGTTTTTPKKKKTVPSGVLLRPEGETPPGLM